jgi:hypothetical protein
MENTPKNRVLPHSKKNKNIFHWASWLPSAPILLKHQSGTKHPAVVIRSISKEGYSGVMARRENRVC